MHSNLNPVYWLKQLHWHWGCAKDGFKFDADGFNRCTKQLGVISNIQREMFPIFLSDQYREKVVHKETGLNLVGEVYS